MPQPALFITVIGCAAILSAFYLGRSYERWQQWRAYVDGRADYSRRHR